MSIQEVKELTKQLKEEQEYSNELQEAIKQKDKQIQELKQLSQEPQIIEKEVIKEVEKEVVPESIKQQLDRLEEEKNVLFEKYEKAKSTIIDINKKNNIEKGNKFYEYDFNGLGLDIADFLRKVSKYIYMEQEYSEIPQDKKTFVKRVVGQVEQWILDMKKAMNETPMIGNYVYGEGEVINNE